MIARLGRIVKSTFERLRKAPGQAIVIQIENDGGEVREVELYQLPGIASGPTPKDRAIILSMGGYRVAIATHNYRVGAEAEPGQVRIFSTDAAGDSVQGEVLLNTDGTVDLNGSAKRFVTWAELDTALQTHTHAAGALLDSTAAPVTGTTGPPVALDISAAETTTIRTGG